MHIEVVAQVLAGDVGVGTVHGEVPVGIWTVVASGYAVAEEWEFDVDARLLHAATDQ